jgi:predicted phosphodiesterase
VRVAALYDVHGNLPALEAALGAARERGAQAIVFGGDLAWGPLPAETVAAIRAVDGARHVRGNADREVADSLVDDPVTRHAVAALGDEARAWLGALPEAQVADVDGLGPVRFVHGSPRSDEETITAATPGERVAEMLAGVSEAVVVCGHTHAQFDRVVGDKRVVNAGSVGLPFGAPGAHWALLGPDVDLVVTPYDTAAAGAAFRAAGGPQAADFAGHAAQPPPASTAAELYG